MTDLQRSLLKVFRMEVLTQFALHLLPQVARTRSRPIASGAVSTPQAIGESLSLILQATVVVQAHLYMHQVIK